jgi:multiple sugar transport system substrate-binding protein
VIVTAIFSGCGSGSDAAAGNERSGANKTIVAKEVEPITLEMFQCCQAITDDQFQNLIAGPVKAKFPNITIELVRQTKDTTPEKLVAAVDFHDLIYTNYTQIPTFADLGLGNDLSGLIKKNNFDLSVFEPITLDAIKDFSIKNTLPAIPGRSVLLHCSFTIRTSSIASAYLIPRTG